MPESNNEPDLIIVSDLHLSEGWDSETKKIDRNEDFFFDKEFCRFLKHFRSKSANSKRKLRLIMAGDIFDFLQVTSLPKADSALMKNNKEELPYGLGTLPEHTIWKLTQEVVPGHWIFFESLVDFVSDGHEIVVIPGNHDIELTDPDVQIAFKRVLLEMGKDEDERLIKSKVRFLPWFYYEPGLIFIEHGHQYDALNSFDYLLYPKREDGTFELPAGSFFVRYLFNQLEAEYPFADNMKPVTQFAWWLMKKHWYRPSCYGGFGKYLVALWKILEKANPIEPIYERQVRAKQKRAIQALAEENALTENNLLKLNVLREHSALHRKEPSCRTCRLIWLLWNLLVGVGEVKLEDKAQEIQKIFGVSYVVFGHTHRADLMRFGLAHSRPIEYYNTGTWTKCFAENHEDALLKSENEFAFCHYSRSNEKMQLMRWNDDRGEPERVRLFQ